MCSLPLAMFPAEKADPSLRSGMTTKAVLSLRKFHPSEANLFSRSGAHASFSFTTCEIAADRRFQLPASFSNCRRPRRVSE